MNLKQFTRLVLPYVVMIVLAVAMVATMFWSDPFEWLQEVLAVDGYWITLGLYAALTIAATVFAPLSIMVTIPFMAEIMGAWPIFVTIWASWLLGSIIAYGIARRYGRPIAGRFFSIKKLENIERRMPTHLDFWVLLLLRIFIPADVLSYAVGLVSKISFRKYVLATAIGIIPFSFILSFGPKALTSDNDILLFVFLAVSGLVVAGLAIFYFSAFLRPKVWIYTHDGKFHTDEVAAVAVLQLVLEQQQRRYEVIRTRDEDRLAFAKEKAQAGEDVYLVDVGDAYDPAFHLFDHHQQAGAGERDNGVGYASLGLVWDTYGIRLCNNKQEVVDELDQHFIQAIDAGDTGSELYELTDYRVSPVTIHNIIEEYYNYHDKWDNLMQDSRFYDAVEWIKHLLPRIIETAKYRVEQKQKAGRIYAEAEDKRIIITEETIGRSYFTRFEDTRLIISPRGTDEDRTWGLVSVPQTDHERRGRVSFPREWWGLRDEELEKVSGIAGAKFCHRSGDFICVAATQHAAIAMAEATLAQYEENAE